MSIDIDLYGIQSTGHPEERDLEFITQGHRGYKAQLFLTPNFQRNGRYLQHQRGLLGLHPTTRVPPDVKANGEAMTIGELPSIRMVLTRMCDEVFGLEKRRYALITVIWPKR